MKTRDWFGLGVRLFGLWLICRGATYVAIFVDTILYPSSGRAKHSAAALLVYVVIDFSIAAFFLFWTRVVVNWSYGEVVAKAEIEGLETETKRQEGSGV